MNLRLVPALALVLLIVQPATALVDAPAASDEVLKANMPAVITITGVMGGLGYQAVTPPGAACWPTVTSGATWVSYTVTCDLPLGLTCGEAAVVRAQAVSTNGRVSADAYCPGGAWAWCSTEPNLDPGYPWDFSQCGGNYPGFLNILGLDPLATYATTIECSATDAGLYGTRAVGAYEVECVFPL